MKKYTITGFLLGIIAPIISGFMPKFITDEETKAQQADLLAKIKADVKAEIEKGNTSNATALKALEDKVNDIKTYDDKTLTDEIVKLSAEIEALKETPKMSKATTLRGAIEKAVENAKEELSSVVKNNGRQSAPITLKVAIDMGEGNTIGAGTTQVSLTENTGIISPIRKRELTYLANVSVGSISNERALWIEELDEQGTPIMLGEGDTKTQLSVRYEEKTLSVKKIAVYGKVTTELLADLNQLVSYIQNNLLKRMDIVLESQLFSGDGLGDNLKGLKTFATTFSAGSLANTIPSANEYDVIEAVALQVQLAFGMPNAIFVHPSTLSKMKLLKDSTSGEYIFPRWASADGLVVSGMRVIPTTMVTAGEFVGGDLSVVNVLNRQELSLQIGLDGNDFISNKKTMLAEKRMVQFVSANDTPCIVKGVFATAKTALATT